MKHSKLTALCLLAASFIPGTLQAESLKNTKPNIIIVITDDQGMGDLACMGNKVVKTPHIDQFFEKSTRFNELQQDMLLASLVNGTLVTEKNIYLVTVDLMKHSHTELEESGRFALETLNKMLKTSTSIISYFITTPS